MKTSLITTITLGSLLIAGTSTARIGETSESDSANAAYASVAPSPLLAIDQNRATVIDRIVGEWGAGAGEVECGHRPFHSCATSCRRMRADQLLAASLAGTLDGSAQRGGGGDRRGAGGEPVARFAAQALGDTNQDLVYVPVRRAASSRRAKMFPAVYRGGGTPNIGQ